MEHNQPNQQPQVSAEQIDAVNRRLDDFAREQQRARTRARAMNATPHVPTPPNFVSLTLHPDMTGAGIDGEASGDAEVAIMIGSVKGSAKIVHDGLTWLTDQAKRFGEMTASLLTPGQHSQRLLASAFATEQTKFTNNLKRVHDALAMLDTEISHFEKQEVNHANAARDSLRVPIATH